MKRKIDSKKCVGCALCVRDCINDNLVIVEKESKRVADFRERGWCIECGHCNAICPQSAIEGGKLMLDMPDMDELLSLMVTKRTVRSYKKNSSISQDVLDKIIFAGQSAPTDRNRKSARMIIIKEMLPLVYNKALDYLVEDMKKTGTINPLYSSTMNMDSKREEILWNAEYLVIFCGMSVNITDAVIAAERMQLEAHYLNVGTAYRGDIKRALNNIPELKEKLEIKKNEEILVCFAMGYPEMKYFRAAVKQNRKVEFK